MEQEIGELIEKLNDDFSVANLEELLFSSGVVDKGIKAEVISFSQFVFLRSTTDEIYGAEERKMIQQLENIYLFPEMKMIVSRGVVPKMLVAADISEAGGDIYDAVLFMKIVIKAFAGWPIFILRLTDGIHLGMRLYERDPKKNCILSEASQTEEILANYMWISGRKEFLGEYSTMYELLNFIDESVRDYDELAIRKKGIQYKYIESLESIEQYMHLDTSYAIRCYLEWFDNEIIYPFYLRFQNALEDLQDITSSKVNTLEMLFEAEELERITYNNEQIYLQTLVDISTEEDKSSEVQSMAGRDPEEMIKLLKVRRGII